MLNPTQVDHYNDEGYVVVPDFLSGDQVAAFLTEMDVVSAGNTLAEHDAGRMEMEPCQAADGTQVRRLYEPCSEYELFGAFSRSQEILDAVEALLGPDLVYHYSKINSRRMAPRPLLLPAEQSRLSEHPVLPR